MRKRPIRKFATTTVTFNSDKKTERPIRLRDSTGGAKRSSIKPGLLYVCLTIALISSGIASAGSIQINSECSLADAINAANKDIAIAGCPAGSGKDFLVLPYKQILFSKTVENGSALPVVSSDIVIEGNNATLQRDERAGNFRFFYVDNSARLTLKNITLKGGKKGPGGAVFVQYGGKLEIQDSILTENNSLSGKGGAIEARGDVKITRSVINHNSAGFSGGGIHITEGSLRLNDSTVSYNQTDGVEGGAGIVLQGHSESKIVNSTISTNTAISGSGGGIQVRTAYPGELTIVNSTIVMNKALDSGGGITSTGYLHLTHSIVSGNQARNAPEIAATGTIEANSYNLFGHSGYAGVQGITLFGGDLVPTEPFEKIVGPLTDNGGKTPTHGLIPGSPAINAGETGQNLPITDQRGVPRPQGKHVDLGSVEAVNVPLSSDSRNGNIYADGNNCTLRDAMTAALTDQETGGCSAGAGSHDTIVLKAASVYRINETLPVINSSYSSTGGHFITIEGNAATITFHQEQKPEQFFRVEGSDVAETHIPVLKLKNVTLTGAGKNAISVIRGQVKLRHTTISDSGIGIRIGQDADLFVNASTISNNKVAGIVAKSNALLVISSSTISGNGWPGIVVGPLAKLKMTDSTISANGGRGLILNSRYYQPEMSRNLVAGNGRKLGNNRNREILQSRVALRWNGGFNLIGYNGTSGADNSVLSSTDIVPVVGIDQILKPLAFNGGFTRTHALSAESPAVDAAGLDCAMKDQRGVDRLVHGSCDIGSFELYKEG